MGVGLGSRSFRRAVQASFAAIGDVSMNDPALGRFIERRDESARVFGFAAVGRVAFLKGTEMTDDSAIAQSAARGLAGAFGGGFGVSHETKILRTRRLVEARLIVNQICRAPVPAVYRTTVRVRSFPSPPS